MKALLVKTVKAPCYIGPDGRLAELPAIAFANALRSNVRWHGIHKILLKPGMRAQRFHPEGFLLIVQLVICQVTGQAMAKCVPGQCG